MDLVLYGAGFGSATRGLLTLLPWTLGCTGKRVGALWFVHCVVLFNNSTTLYPTHCKNRKLEISFLFFGFKWGRAKGNLLGYLYPLTLVLYGAGFEVQRADNIPLC